MAERLTHAGLRIRLGEQAEEFAVSSAGTYAHVGAGMEPYAEQLLAELEVDHVGFAARDLSAEMVAVSDLVLGATREHRAAAVTMLPSASPRTFTLREFARLAELVDVAALPAGLMPRARAAVGAVASKRGYARPDTPADDDVPDPYRGSLTNFRVAAEFIRTSVDALLDVLLG
jgi:protein-tyrosine phosphatase